VKAQGLDPEKDLTIITQAPEVAGPALQANKIDAHADFVPFAELFVQRGFARKIYDGSQAATPTFHGSLANAAFAEKYPEIVVAFLRAAIEADKLVASDPEKYSELIEKVTGIEAPVDYLYHGPLGLQTRDFTWKPEYRQALQTSIETLKLLRRTDTDLTADKVIDDRYIRAAFKASGLDYDARLKNYAPIPLKANDFASGKPITDTQRAAAIWVRGEPKVRQYASIESAFADLRKLDAKGQAPRAVYVHDLIHRITLLAPLSYYASDTSGQVSAFLQKDAATAYAGANKGQVLDFEALRSGSAKLAAAN
jgi:NitT/TauT family transport system substrate-binding protein